jgi:hypothetical protein
MGKIHLVERLMVLGQSICQNTFKDVDPNKSQLPNILKVFIAQQGPFHLNPMS